MISPRVVEASVEPGVATGSSGRSLESARLQIGIRRIAYPVAHEIEREDRDDDGNGRVEKPGRYDQGLDVLGILKQDTPTDGGRPQAKAQEAQRRLADDDRGDRQGGRRD